MSQLRRPWRFFAASVVVSTLGFVLGCGSNDNVSPATANTVNISGKVTFVRVPLVTDANGVPTGLETDSTKFVTQPAQGVGVRFLVAKEEAQPDGTKVTVWTLLEGSSQTTSSEGVFSTTVTKGDKVFVEVLSRIHPAGSTVRIIADGAGMYSSIPQADRTIYSLRKGLDGTTASNLPGTLATADAVVNFEVGLNDKWWLTQVNPTELASAVLEDTGTGSRVLAIAHTLMNFSSNFGTPTPGAALDLHYHRGLSENRGTFIEYNRDLTPPSVDTGTNTRHFFGSISGSLQDDDAFDEGVLLPMFARNFLFSSRATNFLPLDANLTDLTPGLALVEGMAPAMACNLLKSPYLANTTASGVSTKDIRDLSALGSTDKSPFSAPLIAALSWEIGLKAASLPSPGTPADWSTLKPLTLLRFFLPLVTLDTAGIPTDSASLYSQLARLKETKSSSEPVDLAAIFTDATLTTFLQPFNITWPRPTTGPLASFLTDLGKDPNTLATAFSPLAFTMGKAVEVRGAFPNVSAGEVNFAKFTLSKDTAYTLSVTTTPALPPNAQIELFLDGNQTFTFDATTPPTRITLRGNGTTPVLHTLRTRVLSPSVRIPDIQATVRLDVAP